MNLEQYRTLFIVVTLGLALLAASPVLGVVVSSLSLIAAVAMGFYVLPGFARNVANQYAAEFWSVVSNMDVPSDGKDDSDG